MRAWKPVPVAALAGYRNGFPFKPDQQGSTGRPIVRIEQFLNPGVEPARYDGSDVPRRNHIARGDLIFSWSGTLAVGIWDREPAYLNQHLFRVDPRPGVEKDWLRWALIEAVARMTPWMHGSAMTHITRRVLEEVRVPVPPVEEQRRIADYLDSETARIDTLLTKNEQAASLVNERLQTTIADAFGGAVVETSAGVPIGVAGMPTAPLFAVAEVQSGLTLNAANEVDGAPEWAYLRVANVQDGHLALDSVKTVRVPASVASRHRLQNGDVLMTEGGDPDKLGRGTVFRDEVQNCLHQNHVFAARPNQSALLPDYLALATRSPYARMYFEKTASKTTGIASTSATKIGAWRVPLPDIDTQQRIVQQVNRANELTGETIAKLSRQRELLRERRQALITAAVTGEIEV